MGPGGWQVSGWDGHGRHLRARFAGGDAAGPALVDWLRIVAPGEPVTFRGDGGDGGVLIRWLEDRGFTVRRAAAPKVAMKVAALREGLHARVMVGKTSQWLTTGVDEVGFVELAAWLRLFPLPDSMVVYDVGGAAPWLLERLLEEGWSARPGRVSRPWYVTVECYPDRLEVTAQLDDAGIWQETAVDNDRVGVGGLTKRIRGFAPGEPVGVRGSSDDVAVLAAALAAAGVPSVVRRSSRGELVAPAGERHGDVEVQLWLRGLGHWGVLMRIQGREVSVSTGWSTSAWAQTLQAIADVELQRRPTLAIWSEEPGSYHLVLTPAAEGQVLMQLRFLIDDLDGDPQHPDAGVLQDQWQVHWFDLARAWSSASHQLIDLGTAEDLTAHWTYGPPNAELHLLDEALSEL